MKPLKLALVLVFCAAAPVLAQEKAAGAASKMPAGWIMRTDKVDADRSKVRFEEMGSASELHAWTGPAAIFFQPTPVTGDYRFSATFIQMKAPAHPEAYGLFIGGKDLDNEKQEYGYLIVRGDGKYSIKHRAGAEVHTVVDWTEHPAVVKQDETGKAKNTLAWEASEGFVKAIINGQEVKRWEKSYWSGDGLVGLRINHMLDVHISNPSIEALK